MGNLRRDDILAEILPWLRGRVSGGGRMIATTVTDAAMLRFVNSADAPRLAGLDGTYLRRQYANYSAGVRGAHPDDRFGRQMAMMATTSPAPRKGTSQTG